MRKRKWKNISVCETNVLFMRMNKEIKGAYYRFSRTFAIDF